MSEFKDEDTAALAEGKILKGFPEKLVKIARRKITMVRAARKLDDLKSPPGNKMHQLNRDRKGQHAVWVNDKYRICFIWTDNGAEEIEFTDYH